MLKVAYFVEGQTEAIFLRTLLFSYLDLSKTSISIVNIGSGKGTPYSYPAGDPKIEISIFIVEGDGSLFSFLRERASGLLEVDYSNIYGLRDLYDDNYDKLSRGRIEPELSKKFLDNASKMVSELDPSGSLKVFFSIMEVEAWFLAIPKIFKKIDSGITLDKITVVLGKDITTVDPQLEFYKPSAALRKIYGIASKRYTKTMPGAEALMSHMNKDWFEELLASGKVASFRNFFEDAILPYRDYFV